MGLTDKHLAYGDDIPQTQAEKDYYWELKHLEEKNDKLEQQPCDDCISRQEVMYDLCNACELFHQNGEETCLTKCESYHFLATLPSVTPKEKIGHCKITWYKIKERLPEKYGMYLVTLNKLDTDFCEYYPKIKQFGFSGNICDEVTAWAYLPKPCLEYEEKTDGNS